LANAKAILDEAHSHGLTVMLGLWVGHERHGFNYGDKWAVKGQLEGFKKAIRELKDHPALLMWGIGNEVDLFYTDFRVWDAVNDIAKMIHTIDPNHPTVTVTAGLDVAEVQMIKSRAPHIDILAINTYGGIYSVPQQIKSFGWDGAYMITEWGPNGTWETTKTEWGAPIEQTSTEKALAYQDRYENIIAKDTAQCIGSYVFLWGNKQETTATWFGLFLSDGQETEALDVMQYVWSGQWPTNRTPEVKSFTLNAQKAHSNIYLKPRKTYTANIAISDADSDSLKYTWEIIPESTDLKAGGDSEEKPTAITGLIKSQSPTELNFKAPVKKGAYRLAVYASDGHNNCATANIPFYVK
jgi:beta-galactosidase/beta-glucuronidase